MHDLDESRPLRHAMHIDVSVGSAANAYPFEAAVRRSRRKASVPASPTEQKRVTVPGLVRPHHSARRAQGGDSLPVGRVDQGVRWVVRVHLREGVGDDERGDRGEVEPELRPSLLFRAEGGDICIRFEPTGIDHRCRAARRENDNVRAVQGITGGRRGVARYAVQMLRPLGERCSPSGIAGEDPHLTKVADSGECPQLSEAWVPAPMMAATVAAGGAKASAATAPMAPVRRGPSSLPTAMALISPRRRRGRRRAGSRGRPRPCRRSGSRTRTREVARW